MSERTFRVLIVDDSPTARMALRAALEIDPAISVVGEAGDSVQALRLTRRLRPDLVTMDVYLKSGDGIDVTGEIMRDVPTPVVVVTSLDARNPNLVYRAVEAGALEVMGKPPRPGTPGYDGYCRKLTKLVRSLSCVHVIRRRACSSAPPRRRDAPSAPALEAVERRAPAPPRIGWRLLAVGASTGGPPAIRELLDGLPNPMPVPIAIVQHMMPGFIDGFREWLGHETKRRTELVSCPTVMQPGVVYVAAEDRHLEVVDTQTLAPVDTPPVTYQRPSVDRLFESAAAVLGDRTVAALLTGMGRDGAQGMSSLCAAGAVTFVQRPDTCAVPGMPGAAMELGAASAILSISAMARQIGDWVRQGLEPTQMLERTCAAERNPET